MHPLALWSIATDHQRALLEEAESVRLGQLATAGRATSALPRPIRVAIRGSSRALAVVGQAAISASGRLDEVGRSKDRCPCPNQLGRSAS